MSGNISYHQYITTARLQINFTNKIREMLKFAAQVIPVKNVFIFYFIQTATLVWNSLALPYKF